MRQFPEELRELDSAGLLRRLRTLDSPQGTEIRFPDGERILNFSSNDYLGLANDLELKEAFCKNIGKFGVGAGASRLVCGTLTPHHDLEEQLAAMKDSEAALCFSSGFAAATGTIPALCKKGDTIIMDKLCHASLIDGARLSEATMRIFPHNDLNKLGDHLRRAAEKIGKDGRILVITESVFSMDGDRAPLKEIVALKNRHNALLMVDEAHAFGIMGKSGRGLGALENVDDQIDLQMGTFSKAVGLSGGYICADRETVDLLINRARSFVYSTAPPPGLTATISDALSIIAGTRGDALREQLWKNINQLDTASESAIVAQIIGDNEAALEASAKLLDAGFLIPAIRFPTVPRGTARLRITISAAHKSADIESLKDTLTNF